MRPEFSQASDRFVIEGRAGSGGMGDVYKATDQLTGQLVALKVLRDTASPQERVRFMREIAVLADLRHPNIVQYITHGTWSDGRLFFAMEWLEGEDLGQRQRRAPLGMRDAVEIVRRSSAAMAAIHARNVVHRDIKLSNIFLVRGKGTAIKLIDFGVVKPSIPDEYQTERGTIIGTPHFMAPEQARGEAIDARADVYSLGSVLFRLVTGRNVFETEHVIALLGRLVLEDPPNPQSIRFDVPQTLAEVIIKSTARSREDRYENSGDLARALARVGQINNDPPAADRSSSSAIRTVPDPKPITITGMDANPVMPGPSSRPGSAERRVVAVVLFDLGGARLDAAVDHKLREVLGEDTRLEPLLGDQQMVAVLGVERSRGDEVMRAARAAITVTQALSTVRASVAIGFAIRGRANLAGQALDRAVGQIEITSPGTVRVDTHAASALEGRFVLQTDARGGVLLREDMTGFVARQLLGRPTPTVGRDKEIALLQGIYGELIEDATPRGALVYGPAGIGKSRVRSELGQRMETAAVRPDVLLCRGDPLSQSSSLSALGRSLRALMGLQDGEALAEQIQKVKRHVGTRLPPGQRFVAGFLGELAGVTFPDEQDEPLRAARASAELMQARLRMALEALLRAEADRTPQVIIIEDVHWADDTTLEMVDWLLGCADLRFAVFAFGRADGNPKLGSLWDRRSITRLSLAPLAPLAADRLVSAALPGMDAATRANLVRRAGGNALFLEELVRCAAEGRNELPLTVQAVVQLRLDRMSPQVREVLRAAAVFGQSFWTGGATALVGRTVGLELSELVAAEIIARQPESRIAGEDEWIFRQSLVRDAAYEAILDEDRGVLHLSAGNWLESVGDVDAGLIARHADAGGDLERAAGLYARATKQAYTNGAQLETALELANRGLACGAKDGVRAQLLIAKAQFSIFMGRLLDGIAAAEEAAQTTLSGSDMWGEAQRLAAAALIESGRSAEGDARAAQTLAAGNNLSAPIRASLAAVRVRGLVDQLQPGEALRIANEAVEAARASDATDALVRALDARLFAAAHMNDPSEVVTTGASLIEAAESIGDIAFATRGRLNVGSALNHLGMFEDAQAMLERALFDARARRMRILEAFALHNLGMSYARLGNLDLGIDHQRQAARIADETTAARLRINTRIYETIFLVWRGAPGDLGTALSLSRWAIEETRAQPALQILAIFALSRVQLARRALDAALEAARDAHTRLASAPVEEWEELIRLNLFEALLSAGEEEEASTILAAAFHALSERLRTIRLPHHREAFVRRNEEVYRIVQFAYHRLNLYLS